MSSAPALYHPRLDHLTAAQRELLRERAAAAAGRAVGDAEVQPRRTLLEISAGPDRYAVPLEAVAGITELASLAPLPHPAPGIRGLIAFRGEVLIAAELAGLAGGAAGRGFSDLRRVLAVEAGALRVALLCDASLGIVDAAADAFRPAVGQPAFVAGVSEARLTLLDPPALIRFVLALLGGRG